LVAKHEEHRGGSMHYGPDEHSEEIDFELPKSNRTRYAVRQPWDIWTKRMGIQRRLRTEPCKNARSAACHTVGHLLKHCWRFQTAVQK
jgi:hypothetical protein